MTLLLQLLGFAALASAMHATPRPCRLPDGSPARRAARIAGAALLCLSVAAVLRGRPAGDAVVAWFGLATVGAALVLLVLAAVRTRAKRRR